MFRRSPRALALWSAALAVAVVTAVVVATDVASIHRRAATLGPLVHAVVATRDLAVGRRVDATDLGVRDVHASQLPPGALTSAANLPGRVVTVAVLRGGFVTARNVAPRRRHGLDGVLPAGTRAIHVEVSNTSVARVGATVDVIASQSVSTESGASTSVVAIGALILAVDDDGAEGTGRSGDGVTLLVDAEEALGVADAQANGVVAIALVPPEEASRA